MRFDQLSGWLQWLQTLHPVQIELGLDRVKVVAERLNILHFDAKVVAVAGTNGKGSTVATLSALLMQSSIDGRPASVGCYTSPHLIHFSERIAINGVPVTNARLCQVFSQVDAARITKPNKEQTSSRELSLTYFEFTTLAALLIFQQSSLDYVILEVGLGGRLDAVNIVDSDLAIITSIDIDHESWLGDTRESIAIEKAGIVRADKPVIVGEPTPPATLVETLDSHRAIVHWFDTISSYAHLPYAHNLVVDTDGFVSWHGRDREGEIADLRFEPINLPYEGVLSNLSCAIQAFTLLTGSMPDSDKLVSLMESEVPGRMSRYRYCDRDMRLDVAHNVQAVRRLMQRLNQNDLRKHRKIGIFALLDDKAVDKIAGELGGIFDILILPSLRDCDRAITPDHLARQMQHVKASAGSPACTDTVAIEIVKAASVETALETAVKVTNGLQDVIVVFGSFYLVGEVYAQILSSSSELLNDVL